VKHVDPSHRDSTDTAGECTDVDEHGTVGIRLEPAAAIGENRDGTRGSNRLCSAKESVFAGSIRDGGREGHSIQHNELVEA